MSNRVAVIVRAQHRLSESGILECKAAPQVRQRWFSSGLTLEHTLQPTNPAALADITCAEASLPGILQSPPEQILTDRGGHQQAAEHQNTKTDHAGTNDNCEIIQ